VVFLGESLRWSGLLAVGGVVLFLFLFGYVLYPLADGIVLGIVFAYMARPVKVFLDGFASRVSSFMATLVVIGPITLLLGLGMAELVQLIIWLIKSREILIGRFVSVSSGFGIPPYFLDGFRMVLADVSSYALPLLRELPVFGYSWKFALLVLNIVISILVCYYVLRDGGGLVERVLSFVPASNCREFQRFLVHLDDILTAIFIGNVFSAMVVGLLSVLVFWFFGVPKVMALSALMFLAALIPVFAGWMILLPVAVYRYFEHGLWDALVFLVASTLVILVFTELVVRPYIIRMKSEIHPLLIIITFTGGGLIGGMAGFFTAPVVLGVLIAADRVYQEKPVKRLERRLQAKMKTGEDG